MSPEQRETARLKLKELEKTATDEALPEIQRGYQLLGFTTDGLRVNLMRQGQLPRSSVELTKQATRAWAEGRKEDAMRLAAEALARNPYDVRAYQILKLVPPKNIPGQLNLQDPFAQDPGVVKAHVPENRAAPERPANAQAQDLMHQAIQARYARDMDGTFRFALDAMRADPTSRTVQQFYGLVIQDREKNMRRRSTTLGFLNDAVDAENAGKHAQAIALAEKAASVDPDPVILNMIKDLKSKAAPEKAAAPRRRQPSSSGGLPLWPIGAAAGLALAGFGVARSKGTWSSQDLETSEPTEADVEKARQNRYRLKVAAISAAAGFAVVYGGPWLWRAAAPTIAGMWQGARSSVQRGMASEAGGIFPEGAPAAGEKIIPGFTTVESQVINESQQILESPEFAKLQEAYKAGRPVIVKIGGRLIQYEPNLPSEGMSNFGQGGFYLGPKAFQSPVEVQKTVLHEMYRLATSAFSGGVTGPLASRETDETFNFANRAIAVIKK